MEYYENQFLCLIMSRVWLNQQREYRMDRGIDSMIKVIVTLTVNSEPYNHLTGEADGHWCGHNDGNWGLNLYCIIITQG